MALLSGIKMGAKYIYVIASRWLSYTYHILVQLPQRIRNAPKYIITAVLLSLLYYVHSLPPSEPINSGVRGLILLFAAALITTDYNLLKILPILAPLRDRLYYSQDDLVTRARRIYGEVKYREKYSGTDEGIIELQEWDHGTYRGRIDSNDPVSNGMFFWVMVEITSPLPDEEDLVIPVEVATVEVIGIEPLQRGRNSVQIVCETVSWASRRKISGRKPRREFIKIIPKIWNDDNSISPYLRVRKRDSYDKLSVDEWEELYNLLDEIDGEIPKE